MAILYDNFVGGLISDDPLTSGATTINSPGLANLSAVASPNLMWLVLDPDGVAGAPEIVLVTEHTASATSATVIRGQQGTAARQHLLNTEWGNNWTGSDADTALTSVLTTKGDVAVATGANAVAREAVGADGLILVADSAASTGRVWTNRDRAHIVTRDSSLSIADNTATTISYTATVNNEFTHNVGITTVDTTGIYLITGHVEWAANSTGYRFLQLFLAGTLPAGQVNSPAEQGGHAMISTANAANNVAGIVRLNANNDARLRVVQNSGGALDITRAQFSVHLLREL